MPLTGKLDRTRNMLPDACYVCKLRRATQREFWQAVNRARAAWSTLDGDNLIDVNLTEYAPGSAMRGFTCYLTNDELSGYAIRPDGELVNLFSLPRGRGNMLVQSAIANGATRLDCFDGYLVELYSRNGFVEVKREPNWTAGEPDVVYMVLDRRAGMCYNHSRLEPGGSNDCR